MRRSNYSSVLHAIKENFRCAEAFFLRTGRFLLLFSSNIETSCQQNKKSLDKLEMPCGTKFLRVLIFTIFPAIRKNSPPPPTKKKLTKTFFPEKIYSRVLNILSIKFTTQKYSTKKPCKCNYNSPLQFRNKTGNNGLVLHNARTP